MPRIALPQATGGPFDSWDPRSAGYARAYWVGAPPATVVAPPYVEQLAAAEMLLHIVTTAAPASSLPEGGSRPVSWLIDARNELARAFAGSDPLVIVADSAG